ncbi:hypothetical protein D9M69_459490 [compost metagenome]
MSQHLREQHLAKGFPPAHAVGPCRFELAGRNGLEGTAKRLGKVRPENEGQGHDTGQKRVDVDLTEPQPIGHSVEQHLQTEEQQQHDHKVRHAADHRGVTRGQSPQ